jgi:hypothetical protein
MIKYDWKIHSLTKKTINSFDNVIFTVVCEKIGIDEDGYIGSMKTAVNFNIDDIDFDFFVPYEKLTKEIILSWITNFVDENVIDQIINDQFEKSRSHCVQVDDGSFPWNKIEGDL